MIASFAAAQTVTAPLSVTCSGSVSNNVVTWSAAAAGGTSPYTFRWSVGGSSSGNTGSSVTATYNENGVRQAFVQGTDASSTTAISTCSATVTSVVNPTPISPTPPMLPTPKINPPTLSIGERGQFMARGMLITSVASGSFQGQVWGITYTVNWSGNIPEIYLRYAKMPSSVALSQLSQQLNVGDEVGVSGTVSSSSPLVMNAIVVRDYSITVPRPLFNSPSYGQDNGNSNGTGTGENPHATMSPTGTSMMGITGMFGTSASGSVSSTRDIQSYLQELLNKLHNLQGTSTSGGH